MDIFRKIAERKIKEAIEEGEFDDLPLKGQPLTDHLEHVPEEHRSAFRILKNANVLPEEVQLKREMQEIREALAAPELDEEKRQELVRKLNSTESHYNLLMEHRFRRL
jgi:hypothetical protein